VPGGGEKVGYGEQQAKGNNGPLKPKELTLPGLSVQGPEFLGQGQQFPFKI
jgi:hypothetical protein